MARYIIRRILVSIPILLIITFLTFWAVKLGTDPVASYLRVNPRASAEQILAYQEANGLVGSTPEQYFRWLGNFLTGDWGESIKGRKPVFPDIKAALGNTLVLGGNLILGWSHASGCRSESSPHYGSIRSSIPPPPQAPSSASRSRLLSAPSFCR